ncbi:MAG: hypothetical protein ABW006_14740 [Hyphomicrobium sp.]
MTTTMQRTKARTLRGWAISVLDEAGAIRECEEHCWIRDRADPHARKRAFDFARSDPPSGATAAEAVAALDDLLSEMGDVCPECLPE